VFQAGDAVIRVEALSDHSEDSPGAAERGADREPPPPVLDDVRVLARRRRRDGGPGDVEEPAGLELRSVEAEFAEGDPEVLSESRTGPIHRAPSA
jgi:hypothetical protein